MYKRIPPLLLALALVVPVLLIAAPVTVRADEVIVDFTTPSYGTVSSGKAYFYETHLTFYESNYLEQYFSILKNLPQNCVLVISFLSYFYGMFVDVDGRVVLGKFTSSIYSKDNYAFGVKNLSSFTLVSTLDVYTVGGHLAFIDEASAVSYAVNNQVVTGYISSITDNKAKYAYVFGSGENSHAQVGKK